MFPSYWALWALWESLFYILALVLALIWITWILRKSSAQKGGITEGKQDFPLALQNLDDTISRIGLQYKARSEGRLSSNLSQIMGSTQVPTPLTRPKTKMTVVCNPEDCIPGNSLRRSRSRLFLSRSELNQDDSLI